MSRKRVIYQSEALYRGPSPASGFHFELDDGSNVTGVVSDTLATANEYDARLDNVTASEFNAIITNLTKQLHRIQSISYDFSIDKTPINQFGELAEIDRVALSTPTVNLGFSYLLANMANEVNLGFNINGTETALKDILDKTKDDANYFVKTVSEGVDAIGDTTNAGEIIAVGDGYITSYSSEGSVGNLPVVNVSVEGTNILFDNTVSGNHLPYIDPNTNDALTGYTYHVPDAVSNPGGFTTGDLATSVLRPGDIKLSVKKRTGTEANATADYDLAGVDLDEACIQSYNISFDLNREMIECLGKRFAVSRDITPPVNVSFTVDALVGDLTTGSLSDIINCDDKYDIFVDLYEPNCVGQAQDMLARYIGRSVELDSMSFSSDIGSNKSVTLSFSTQVSGPNQTTKGIFMSGIAE
jgi:hypothetical protein